MILILVDQPLNGPQYNPTPKNTITNKVHLQQVRNKFMKAKFMNLY